MSHVTGATVYEPDNAAIAADIFASSALSKIIDGLVNEIGSEFSRERGKPLDIGKRLIGQVGSDRGW